MYHNSPPIGNRITAVLYGISDASLLNNKFLREAFERALKADDFSVVGILDYPFEPTGYSAVALLKESDAAIHSYPEYNSLDLNLTTCRGPKDGRKTLFSMIEDLSPYCTHISESPVIVKPMAEIPREALEGLLEGYYMHNPLHPDCNGILPLEFIGDKPPQAIAGVPNNLLRQPYAP